MNEKMSKQDTDTLDLDGFFEAAKSTPPSVSSELASAVLADAYAFQPAPAARPRQGLPKSRWWQPVLAHRNWGWQTAAVLGAFLVVGFGIGWNPPDQLLAFGSDYGLTLSGFAASDPFSLDGIWEEG